MARNDALRREIAQLCGTEDFGVVLFAPTIEASLDLDIFKAAVKLLDDDRALRAGHGDTGR